MAAASMRLGHRTEDCARQHYFVNLFSAKDLDGERDVVRVLLGRGLVGDRAEALGLLRRRGARQS